MNGLGDVKAAEAALNGNSADQDVKMQDSSDLSDLPGSDEETERRQKETRRTAAKERELARQKAASTKQAIAEHRRLDEEVNKLERRLEGIEREFRKLLGSVRVKPLGRDRFYNRIWWFDGMGAASLVGSGGTVQYGTGRVFVQGPSEFDVEILQRREGDINARRKVEEGEEGMLGVGEWAVFNDLEEVRIFAWSCSRLMGLTVLPSVERIYRMVEPERCSGAGSQECLPEVVVTSGAWHATSQCSTSLRHIFRFHR